MQLGKVVSLQGSSELVRHAAAVGARHVLSLPRRYELVAGKALVRVMKGLLGVRCGSGMDVE